MRIFPLLLLLLVTPVSLAGPLDDLLPLVPDDTGVCLIVGNLRQHQEQIITANWVKKLRNSHLGQMLLHSPEVNKLLQVEQELKKHLDLTWPQLRDDILGDAVVFAHRQGPPGRPEEERGLLLLWTRNPPLVARLIDAVNREQRRTGELKALEKREHQGISYWQRKESKQDRYYFLQGNVLAYGSTEAVIQTVIARLKLPAEERSFGPVTQSLNRLECDKTLVTAWLNPRAFESELQLAADRARGPEAGVLRTLGKCWQALDGLAVSLSARVDVELRLTLHGRSQDLPSGIRALCQAQGGESGLWQYFPADGILTCAGRLAPAALFQAVGELQSEEPRQKMRAALQRNLGAVLGLDFFEEILPHTGPDWGMCVARNPEAEQMPHLLLAVRVEPGPRKNAPVDQGLSRTLQLFAGLAVFDHNNKHKDKLRLRTSSVAGGEVYYLDGPEIFPPGVQPAWGLREGYLVLASSPAALKRFAPKKSATGAGATLRLSLQELTLLIKDQRTSVARLLSSQNQMSEQSANDWIDNLLWGLGLFERLELQQRRATGQAIWTLRLTAAR